MKKNNKIVNGYGWIMPGFLSVLAYGLLSFIIRRNIGYIPVTLAYSDTYIPAYYWLALIAYTFIYSLSNKIKFSGLAVNMLVLGLFLHIYLMLLQLNQFLLFKPDYTRMYLYYAFIIETGLFALCCYSSCRKFWINKSFYNPHAIYLYLPLTINVIYQLYRDVKHINLLYFCFHLAVLTVVCFLCKMGFYFPRFDKENIVGFIKKEKTIVILVFLFSFLARAIFAFHIVHSTGDRFPTASDDGPSYDQFAVLIMQDIKNLFSGGQIVPNTYDPGYSIFLGFVYKIFGHSFYAAGLIQSLLGSLMVVGVYLIAKVIFNKKIGLIAAILTAINQPLIMLAVVLTTEALYIPLLVFSIYCLVKFSENIERKKGNYWLFIGGFIIGLAIITRAMLLLFPGMVICWLLLHERGLKWIKSVMIFIAGLIPVLCLITILTFTNTGEFKCFTNKQDPNWIAFAEKNEFGKYLDPRHVYSNAKLIEMGINPIKDLKGSISTILKNPLKVLKIEAEILPKRLKLFLFWPNFGFFDPIFILTSTTPNQYASTLEFYALLIFIIGVLNVLINKGAAYKSSLIFLLIFYYLIIHVGLTAGQCARYRVPLLPFSMIFAACGLYLIYKKVLYSSSLSKLRKW